jgi:ketosteroid isomerase-like protein
LVGVVRGRSPVRMGSDDGIGRSLPVRWTWAAACLDTSVAMSDENVAVVRRAFDAYTRGAFGFWPEQWDDFRVEIGEILADPGDQVVVDSTFLFAIRDGKIAEWRIFVRESQALAAAGER